MALGVALLLVTGLELPGWLDTLLMALGAFAGLLGLYGAYLESRQER